MSYKFASTISQGCECGPWMTVWTEGWTLVWTSENHKEPFITRSKNPGGVHRILEVISGV